MKSALVLLAVSFFVFGCSKSPLERLETEKPDISPKYKYGVKWEPVSKKDRAYWIKAAEEGSENLKKASEYCEYHGRGSDRCEFIIKLETDCEMDKQYEPGGWLARPRDVVKKNCSNLDSMSNIAAKDN